MEELKNIMTKNTMRVKTTISTHKVVVLEKRRALPTREHTKMEDSRPIKQRKKVISTTCTSLTRTMEEVANSALRSMVAAILHTESTMELMSSHSWDINKAINLLNMFQSMYLFSRHGCIRNRVVEIMFESVIYLMCRECYRYAKGLSVLPINGHFLCCLYFLLL